MRAVILAAGRGSRLHPYTADCPKCLTELGGRTLIERQIATLRDGGIDDIVIVAGYLSDRLLLADTRQVVNPLWETTNMVESLFAAETLFGDDLIVAYSDIVYEPRILSALLSSPHDCAVTVDRNWRALWEWRFVDPLSDAESLRLDEHGRIVEIGQPATDMDAIEAQYMGLLRFKGEGITRLRDAYAQLGAVQRPWMARRPVEKAYMTDLLTEMVLMGTALHAVPVEGGWLEIDTVEDYERIAAAIANGSILRFFDPQASPSSVGYLHA